MPSERPEVAPICVDVETAAVMEGVSPSAVRGWIDRGLLPVVKFPSVRRPGEASRRVLVMVEDLREFARRHRDTAPEPNAALSQAAVRRWRERAS